MQGHDNAHPRPDEEAALLAVAAADVDAFEQLYWRYVRRVAAFAARRCDSPEDAADVVAQTFARLLRSTHRYDAERGTVAAFVYALARSEVADLRRHAARRRALASRIAGRRLLDRDDMARLEDAIDAARVAAALAEPLDELPPGEGELLRLVAEGLTPREAATRLDISAEAARTRLARARHRLRAHRPGTPDRCPKGAP